MKYNGPNVATSGPTIIPNDWINYQTTGIIKIENKSIENNKKVIKGRINLQLLENNNIIKTYNDIKFVTGSFLN